MKREPKTCSVKSLTEGQIESVLTVDVDIKIRTRRRDRQVIRVIRNHKDAVRYCRFISGSNDVKARCKQCCSPGVFTANHHFLVSHWIALDNFEFGADDKAERIAKQASNWIRHKIRNKTDDGGCCDRFHQSMNNTFGQKNVPRCPNKTSLATLTLGARSTLRLRILILIVIHVLDIGSPWIVFEFMMRRAWGPDMWTIFGVATAACLYYSGDYLSGEITTGALKVMAIRLASYFVASVSLLLLPIQEPSMALMGGCAYLGGNPWNLFGWTEFCSWIFALPVIPVLRAFRQVAASSSCECKSQKSLAPRKKAEF